MSKRKAAAAIAAGIALGLPVSAALFYAWLVFAGDDNQLIPF